MRYSPPTFTAFTTVNAHTQTHTIVKLFIHAPTTEVTCVYIHQEGLFKMLVHHHQGVVERTQEKRAGVGTSSARRDTHIVHTQILPAQNKNTKNAYFVPPRTALYIMAMPSEARIITPHIIADATQCPH